MMASHHLYNLSEQHYVTDRIDTDRSHLVDLFLHLVGYDLAMVLVKGWDPG